MPAPRRQERLHGVTLEDIADVEAFVVATLRKSGIPFTQDQWEDLIAEGIAILYHLHSRYEHQRDGYTQPGRFSGYAAMYLPKRLSKAWHRSQPNHVLTRQPDGTSRWVVHDRPVSLNQLLDDAHDDLPLSDEQEACYRAIATTDDFDPLLDLHGGNVTSTYGAPPSSFVCNMNGALRGQIESEHRLTVNVAWLRGMDLQRAQIADTLNVSEVEVRMAIERIKRIGRDLAA